jgi:hypothetical protein
MPPTTGPSTSATGAPATTDAFAGFNSLLSSFEHGIWALAFGLLCFGAVAGVILWLFFQRPYETGAKVAAGVAMVVLAGIGVWQLIRAYHILNDATNGALAVLISALPAAIPLLILIVIVRVVDRR